MGMEPHQSYPYPKIYGRKRTYLPAGHDPNDKRMVRICLTELGIEMRELSKASVLHFNQTIQSKIGKKKKLANFFDTMSEINTILETEQIFENEKINS